MSASRSHRVLLIVGGGIASYKAATVCSRLAQSGHQVQTVMTRSATEFLGPATLAALSGRPVGLDGSFAAQHPLGAHIELAREVDLLVVAPATANLIGKFAHGIADSLASTLYLQNQAPVLVAPAMSDPMWSQPSVQRNIQQLQQDGCHTIGPESGWLSCRVLGQGRMSEPESILERIEQILSMNDAKK